MTIEIRSTTSKSHQQQQQQQQQQYQSSMMMMKTKSDETRTSSVSSNGYQPDSPSEDDGYYTSAVSVQHKVKEKFLFSHRYLQKQIQNYWDILKTF
jgi:hypothetical protein